MSETKQFQGVIICSDLDCKCKCKYAYLQNTKAKSWAVVSCACFRDCKKIKKK